MMDYKKERRLFQATFYCENIFVNPSAHCLRSLLNNDINVQVSDTTKAQFLFCSKVHKNSSLRKTYEQQSVVFIYVSGNCFSWRLRCVALLCNLIFMAAANTVSAFLLFFYHQLRCCFSICNNA